MIIRQTTTVLLSILAMASIFPGLSCSSLFKDDPVEIGKPWQGGIVAYIYKQGDPGYVPDEVHGIIASPYDNANNIHWAENEKATGAVEVAIGKGIFNTFMIMAAHGAAPSAAKVCRDLNINGYTDWMLPSRHELEKLWEAAHIIGGFDAAAHYWSSSESFQDSKNAGTVNFAAGNFNYHLKTSQNHHVRAIRYF